MNYSRSGSPFFAYIPQLDYICCTEHPIQFNTQNQLCMSELALQLIQKAHEEKAKVLDLGRCGLRTLPKELFELVWLEELYVCNCYYDWEKRKWIDSSNKGKSNVLSHIPKGMEALSALKKLYLNGDDDNRWKIQKIADLNSLLNLAYLDLSSNQMLNLAYLDLSSNQITKLENLDGLQNLSNFDISSNQITKLENLDGLQNLSNFSISSNQITKLENLDGLQNLSNFSISSNQITKLENLDGLQNLSNFDISSNQITKLENLDGLQNLSNFYISSNQITKLEKLRRATKFKQFLHSL